jgi:hypothetical protein
MTVTVISGVTLDGVVQAPASRTRTPATGLPTAAGECPMATTPKTPPGPRS